MNNTNRKYSVLICDDEQAFHLGLRQVLKEIATTRSAYNGDEAIAILRNQPVDLILLDVQIRSDREGVEYIRKFKAIDPAVTILMNSSVTDYAVVREALKAGASDYLAKGEDPEAILITIQQALERSALQKRVEKSDFETSGTQKQHAMIGSAPALREVQKLIEKFRTSHANVLITGETGVGKEVVARALRKQFTDGGWEPFVAIDSSTIQHTMAESILFGHEKGSFTGAEKQQKGVFEEANGGILYFDEIANLPLAIQPKLLRVLQEKEVMRLGSAKPIPLEFRVVCATNQDLEALVKAGQFKEDLWQRLSVLPITIPPLRERTEDVPALVEHFVRRLASPANQLRFSDEAMHYLQAYRWPGNVRELSNVVAYIAAMADGERVEASDLPPKLRDRVTAAPGSAGTTNESSASFYTAVAEFERQLLARELAGSDGNLSKLALKLGMDRSHLYSKLKEYGLERKKTEKK